ncbi:uncharacterized protein EI90DRAFT_2490927 [Cantharellus anzutake]|uniref:uncharacterized protein n=1 Tax=Cantharellus anzutake TaxID=1750568 RepID=UPI00190781D9|nr:uncharacterized protein EI90DRAFT_2490927 [Cantharellus anzutake]KAF8322006.1 hypothetical protein EI90DRAFT_2490927 [Cantharellus anzutake]
MRCGYWAPRVRILFNGALKTGDLSPLVAYLEIRASMPDCLGSRGYVPGPEPRMEWFTLKVDPNNPNDSLSGFIVCRACYEDVVMATPHYTHFRKHWRTQLPDQVWTCDVGNGWGRLVLNPFVSNNQDLVWSAVVTKLCSGFRKKCYRKSRNHTELWWRLRDNLDIKSLAVCDPCHKRFIAPSDYLTEWEPVSQSEPLISPSIQEPLLACAMSDSRLLCSWEIARLLGLPVSTWREVALVILHCEPCTRQEEIGKKWYRITSSPNLCNICSGCYYTFFYALGFGSHFYRDTVNPDDGATSQRRICDLYPYSPYFPTLIRKLYEAGAVGDIDIFLRYVRERKDLRLCPLGHVEADPEPMRWYGDGDSFIACEECYFDVIRNSSLAQHVRRCDPRNSSQYQRCTLWSDRMRTQWANACQRGDLTEFTDFCKTRAWAFKETMFRAIQMNREINTQRGLGAGERGEAKATIDRLFQQWQGWC